jgi:hypothetical protein
MAHRTFVDSRGVQWQVWDVIPDRTGRRRGERRMTSEPVEYERRTVKERRLLVSPGLEAGWLAFDSPIERRRLYPVPEGWAAVSEKELEELMGQARIVPKSKGRLIE